jgi:hypothetical protein
MYASRTVLRPKAEHSIPASNRRGIVTSLLMAAGCALAPNDVALAQTIDQSLWITDGYVDAVVRDGGTIYIGGGFTWVGPATGGGGQARLNIAALDAATGAATPWNPNADGIVLALAVSGSTVYAGGEFTGIGGHPRNRVAALDATTGVATAWNPNANGYINALAVNGSTVYAGGIFNSIGGQIRWNIAALDVGTGSATAWDADANDEVRALAVSDSIVYAGGYFTGIGGNMRNHIAALDATTGAATAWNPSATHEVHALAVNGSTVYAGGSFFNIGGQPRNCIAALDAATGLATTWNPNAESRVRALAVGGSTIYAGGEFGWIGGQVRNHIAALDAVTGAATAWNPNASAELYALAVSGPTVYAGGLFASIGGLSQSHIAAIAADMPTATELSLVNVNAAPGRVELTWHASARDVSSAAVFRRTDRTDWQKLGQIWADGTGRLDWEDTQVIAGARYGYRLGLMEAGQVLSMGETWVDVPSALELSLALRSNPAPGDLGVAFSLPDASPARLELFDVSGRRVAARDVGTLGAGSHVIALGDGRALSPGVYLLRLTQSRRSLSARAAILR